MTTIGKALFTSLAMLLSMYGTKYREQDAQKAFPNNPQDLTLPQEDTYDFIVVGAGTAGCVVARRLVDAGFKTLLLEAGGNSPPIYTVPALWSDLRYLSPEVQFIYPSVPQKNAWQALSNPPGVFPTMTGKMMGGTSSVNAQVYNRGNAPDFNNWAKLTGDNGWRYENILKFFLKAEKYRGEFRLNGQHSRNGMMTVSAETYDLGRKPWLAAGRELGYANIDPNGPQTEGFAPIEVSVTEKGRRDSSYTAYIKPIENRRNNKLTVSRYSVVSQVYIETSPNGQKKATGVAYTRHKISRSALASKAVILSAGSYMSPIILLNSGVGPKGNVTQLPVGENLHDHISLSVPFQGPFHYDIANNLSRKDVQNFLNKGKGPLQTLLAPTQAFIMSARDRNLSNTQVTGPTGIWPDMTIFFDYPLVFNALDRNPLHTECAIVFGRPRSRGTIKLNQTALDAGLPLDDPSIPLIDYNFFGDPSDFDSVIDGITTCEKIVKSKAMQRAGAVWLTDPFPACKNIPFGTRLYWICYIRSLAGGTYHTAGSCKMGAEGDPTAVVDTRLRVQNIDGLRVVDASIMPMTPNGNTAAPSVMIGEKGADMIIKDYGGKNRNPENREANEYDAHSDKENDGEKNGKRRLRSRGQGRRQGQRSRRQEEPSMFSVLRDYL